MVQFHFLTVWDNQFVTTTLPFLLHFLIVWDNQFIITIIPVTAIIANACIRFRVDVSLDIRTRFVYFLRSSGGSKEGISRIELLPLTQKAHWGVHDVLCLTSVGQPLQEELQRSVNEKTTRGEMRLQRGRILNGRGLDEAVTLAKASCGNESSDRWVKTRENRSGVLHRLFLLTQLFKLELHLSLQFQFLKCGCAIEVEFRHGFSGGDEVSRAIELFKGLVFAMLYSIEKLLRLRWVLSGLAVLPQGVYALAEIESLCGVHGHHLFVHLAALLEKPVYHIRRCHGPELLLIGRSTFGVDRQLQICTTSVRLINVDNTIFEIVGERACKKRNGTLLKASPNHDSAVAIKVDSSLRVGTDLKPGCSKILVLHFQDVRSGVNQNTDFLIVEKIQ
ncbi:hypothetical protein HG531_012281 [Fusarium graminearum]|nr:hypothetical protein HG531_012281 [Fusarium graminearum]